MYCRDQRGAMPLHAGDGCQRDLSCQQGFSLRKPIAVPSEEVAEILLHLVAPCLLGPGPAGSPVPTELEDPLPQGRLWELMAPQTGWCVDHEAVSLHTEVLWVQAPNNEVAGTKSGLAKSLCLHLPCPSPLEICCSPGACAVSFWALKKMISAETPRKMEEHSALRQRYQV